MSPGAALPPTHPLTSLRRAVAVAVVVVVTTVAVVVVVLVSVVLVVAKLSRYRDSHTHAHTHTFAPTVLATVCSAGGMCCESRREVWLEEPGPGMSRQGKTDSGKAPDSNSLLTSEGRQP